MPRGISLHIGVNKVDKNHYLKNEVTPWDGALDGCEADANKMEALAKKQGFEENYKLLTQEATTTEVIRIIKKAAADLKAKDYFFITFSGHGGQVDDMNGDEADSLENLEDDLDETWCLYDRMLFDDELFQLWSSFKEGVRIILFSDSCHSGSVAKTIGDELPFAPEGIGYRYATKASLGATYTQRADSYDDLQLKLGERPIVKARVLSFSACQDDELAQESKGESPTGIFTKAVLEAWEVAESIGANSYQEFFNWVKIKTKNDKQTPNYIAFGLEDSDFENGKPLVIH